MTGEGGPGHFSAGFHQPIQGRAGRCAEAVNHLANQLRVQQCCGELFQCGLAFSRAELHTPQSGHDPQMAEVTHLQGMDKVGHYVFRKKIELGSIWMASLRTSVLKPA